MDVTQSSADPARLRHRLEDGRLSNGVSRNKVKLILEDGATYAQEGALQFRDVTVDRPRLGDAADGLPQRQTDPPSRHVRLAVVEEGG